MRHAGFVRFVEALLPEQFSPKDTIEAPINQYPEGGLNLPSALSLCNCQQFDARL